MSPMLRGSGALAVAPLFALGALASPARASPLDLFGFGGRSPAMAGTGVAFADDYDAVYLNPAGLADARRKRATIGAVYGDFTLALDGRDTGTEAATGLVFGGVVPMPLGGPLRDRVGLGIGFYVPTQTLNRARHPFPGQPVYVLLESRAHVVAVQVAAGVRIAPRWSVGAGVIALAALRGGIDVTTDASGRFTTFSQQRMVSRFAPIVGARWRQSPRLAVAATVRGASRSDYDIRVTSDLGDAIPVMLPRLRIAGTAQYDPLTAAVEGTWRASSAVALTAQLAYQRWSAFPPPTLTVVASRPPARDPGFHDTAVPRAGAEWTIPLARASLLAARAGYAFLWSPAPEMRGEESLLDNHRHLVSLGVGVSREGTVPLSVDLWLQAHLLMPRRHVKDAGLFGPGEDIPFDVIETRGHILVGGLTVGVGL